MMRDETIHKVLDFPLPTRVKQLSSIIGLVQYFRNHIYADCSSLLFRLQQLTNNQVKTHIAEGSFYKVKEKIRMQTKPFWYKEGEPIYMLTDTSDYGLGGFL